MVVKFLKKYVLEVVPSVIATVLGAYIVTHYINAKPDADKAKTEAASPAAPVKEVAKEPAKPTAEQNSIKVNLPVEKKSIAVEKPAVEKPVVEKQTIEKSGKPSETAIAPETRRHQPVLKEIQKSKSAKTAPVAVPSEAVAVEDARDANEIARAAIERLRHADRTREQLKPVDAARVQETSRTQEAVRPVQDSSRLNVVYTPAQAAAVQSAPAPMVPASSAVPQNAELAIPTVSAPPPPAMMPPPVARADDPSRPTPPGEIPSRPLDLRASGVALDKDRTSVAEDVLSAAKSVINAVTPR